MNSSLINKAIAVTLLGVIFGWYTHYDYVRWSLLGREAFIAHQMHRFELYMAVPRSLVPTMFGGVVVAIGLFGVYELMVLALSKILRNTSSVGENS
jgi:hypothetical protein